MANQATNAGKEADPRHDNRLTVVQATWSYCGKYTVVEAIGTNPGKRPQTRWFRFRLYGRPKVEFGWLIGFIDAGHALLYWHPDEPGTVCRVHGRVAELEPIK